MQRIDELQAALKSAHRQIASLRSRSAMLADAVFEAARVAALSVDVPAPPKLSKRQVKGCEVALLHLTDWQRGKSTVSYSSEVCDARVSNAVAKAVEISDLQKHQVDEIVVLLGGDMVEGVSIFPGQVWEVDSSLYEQMFGCAALIASVVSTLLGSFKRVTVIEEFGNHGRIGRRGDVPPIDNVDLFAYRIAEGMLPVDGRRLSWVRAVSWHQVFSIGAYKALLVHGDEIRSYGGNHPVYGIVKKVSAWQAGVLDEFTDCYMGHFHRPDTYTLPSGGSVYLTGSPESGNEYAREFVAAVGRPSQRLHFVDPRRGRVTAEYRLWLD